MDPRLVVVLGIAGTLILIAFGVLVVKWLAWEACATKKLAHRLFGASLLWAILLILSISAMAWGLTARPEPPRLSRFSN